MMQSFNHSECPQLVAGEILEIISKIKFIYFENDSLNLKKMSA
jgi:hypothetical protein